MNTSKEMLPETVKAGDVIENVQLTPFGDWPNGGVVQHVTREACDEMVADWIANGSKEILLDFEHKSASGGTSDTSAAAWISNIRVDPERGLVGDFKFTDVGADAIANRRLRFLSPVWRYRVDAERVVENKTVPAEVTPVQLLSCGLTNRPAIPVDPILNKSPEVQGSVPEPNNKENPNMDKIKEVLGLAPEASEEEVLNAIAAMVKTNKECEEAKKVAEQKALEDEAERFAEENKTKCNKEVLKAQYIANKEVAKALVAGIPEAKTDQIVLNKGKTPGTDDVRVMLNKCKTSAERIAFAKEHAQELLDAAK